MGCRPVAVFTVIIISLLASEFTFLNCDGEELHF